MKRVLTVCLIVCLMMSVLSGCLIKSDEEKINDRINDFLSAYNSGSLEKVIETLDGSKRNQYKSLLGIGDALIAGKTGYGIKLSDIFGLSFGLSIDKEGTEQTLSIVDRTISIDSENKATVTASIAYNAVHVNSKGDIVITMVKENGDWYIKDIKDNK